MVRSATDQGCAFPQGENAGGLCVLRCAAPSGRADPEPGRGRLLEPKRAGYFSWGNRQGKTHLATGLAMAACRQRKRVRFTTAAQLVNELTEAKNRSELNRVTGGRA